MNQKMIRSRNPIIKLENVTKNYKIGEIIVNALNNIDLEILNQEFLMVMGPSGSGKSTLLNIMAGLEPPSTGRVTIHQDDLTKFSDKKRCLIRRETLGFVFQFFNLHPVLSAQENVELPMLIRGDDQKIRKKRSLELLRLVNLENRKNHLPHELSGGEKQRVGIARSLANNPEIILADEPTGDLDSENGHEIMKLLINLCKNQSKTVICVTHDEVMLESGMRLIRMEDGHIILDSIL